MKKLILLSFFIPILGYANTSNNEKFILIPHEDKIIRITENNLMNNEKLTQILLTSSLKRKNIKDIEFLLDVYSNFLNKDDILELYTRANLAILKQKHSQAISYYRQILADNPELTAVRIELAIALFNDKQNNFAKEQFLKSKLENNLPPQILELIDIYLNAIENQNDWKLDVSLSYENNKNINNISKSTNIENTGYVKNDSLLPKSAKGISFSFNLNKDINVYENHYISFRNEFYGKYYWDNKDYNDMVYRSSLGYQHRNNKSMFNFLPFYERRWFAEKTYNQINGARLEYTTWLTSHYKILVATEWGKQHYFYTNIKKGYTRLFSPTLFWTRNPQQYFYLGVDFNQENLNIRQYSSNTNSIRTGWVQEWNRGISSRLSLSYSYRIYKDLAVLGDVIPLGKVRKDKIYTANLTLWKRDWHILGITPKLQLKYKNNKSNIPTMFSYSDKSITMLFEKEF